MKSSRRLGFVVAALACSFALWGACGGGGESLSPTVTATTLDKVLTTGGFTITFSADMDRTSVEAALSVTGSGPVSGTITWVDDSNATFLPANLWKTHHQYTLTIGTGAQDAFGRRMASEYTATFRPELNMHDINGDGIDDFILAAPGHNYDATAIDTGVLYLFLGKTTWADVDLASQTADATILFAQNNLLMGMDARVVGDINGDGFADIVASSRSGPGFIVVIYGSASPTNVTVSGTDYSVIAGLAKGLDTNSYLGFPVMPAGDVNGDGLADFVLGSRIPSTNDMRFWLVPGRTEAFPMPPPPLVDPSTFPAIDTIANASFTVFGDLTVAGYPVAACDVNGDEFDDLLFGSPLSAGGGTQRGQAYVVRGSAAPVSMDLRSEAADVTLTGAEDSGWFGFQVACGDINNDGFGDIVAAAPAAGALKGRVYLTLGAASMPNYNFATQAPAAIYVGAAANDRLGVTDCVQGDVNDDGFNDLIIGNPMMTVGGNPYQGSAYLFLGAATPASVDLSAGQTATATYVGVVPPASAATALGYCKPIGDVNNDGIDDILLGAPMAHGAGAERGQAYLIFGSSTPASYYFETQKADATFTGAADGDLLNVTSLLL